MLPVIVIRIENEAIDVRSFELASVGAPLPAYAPGAHIEVQLTPGLSRAYSLCGRPSDGSRYLIAAKRAVESEGGSSFLHEQVKPGDRLLVSAPRNNFPMAAPNGPVLLIAAGIGITPLLSMAYHLEERTLPYHLHYFARSPGHAAFRSILAGAPFARATDFHWDVSAADVLPRLDRCLANAADGAHIYTCGPDPFMEAVKSSPGVRHKHLTVHFERFSAASQAKVTDQPFTIILRHSGLTLTVPGDKTILKMLQEAGVPVHAVCRQGTCGACLIDVVDGIPDHRDEYLTEAERVAGNTMCVCVSRAKSSALTLDI